MGEIAKCRKCRTPIDESHSHSWCTECGEPLPDAVKQRLPGLATILAASAPPPTTGDAPRSVGGARSPARSPIGGGQPHRSYKVVPFIGEVTTGFFSSGNAGTVAQQLSAAIERESVDGWDFHSFAKVDIEVKPGCIASLLGARTSYITFDQLIFRAKSAPTS